MRLTLIDPAHDLQAIDRAFRIGQSRDVEVFRLLGAGSIEELMYARQVYKQQQMRIGYDASIQTRSGSSPTIPTLIANPDVGVGILRVSRTTKIVKESCLVFRTSLNFIRKHWPQR